MRNIFFAFFFFLGIAGLQADDHSLAHTVLQSMAEAPDPIQKLEVLSSIEHMLSEGADAEDAAALAGIAGYLACEGIVRLRIDDLQLGNDYPHVRLEANRVLGLTGSPEAVEYLMTVLLNEPLSHILSAAVKSAGQISTGNKKLNAAFYLILTGKRLEYRNEDLVYETLMAVDAISSRNSGYMGSSKIREGVAYVAERDNGFLRETRNLAKKILDEY